MKKNRIFWLFSAWIVLGLAACSVDLAQSPGMQSPTADLPTPRIEEQQNPAAPAPTAPAQAPAGKPAVPGVKIERTWSALGLSGKLIFVSADQKDTNPILRIQELDLGSGDLYTLFQAPPLSWIYTMSVAPDGQTVYFSYTPPAANGSSPVQAIYRMPLDGSKQPEQVFSPPAPEDQYLHPQVSPDGKYLYFAHTNYKNQPKDQHYPTFEIDRMALPDGKPEKIADQAFWPRLSADGQRLVYISSDPTSGKNKIYVAGPDGKNAAQVALEGANPPDIIDAPIFSADGQSILFSAPLPQKPASRSWFDLLTGVDVVDAHTVPSEWWKVPVGGGTPQQLTHIQAPGLYAALSPDGQHFACYTSTNLFVMDSSAQGLTRIFDNLGGIYGSVSWIP